MKQDQVTVRRI